MQTPELWSTHFFSDFIIVKLFKVLSYLDSNFGSVENFAEYLLNIISHCFIIEISIELSTSLNSNSTSVTPFCVRKTSKKCDLPLNAALKT